MQRSNVKCSKWPFSQWFCRKCEKNVSRHFRWCGTFCDAYLQLASQLIDKIHTKELIWLNVGIQSTFQKNIGQKGEELLILQIFPFLFWIVQQFNKNCVDSKKDESKWNWTKLENLIKSCVETCIHHDWSMSRSAYDWIVLVHFKTETASEINWFG